MNLSKSDTGAQETAASANMDATNKRLNDERNAEKQELLQNDHVYSRTKYCHQNSTVSKGAQPGCSEQNSDSSSKQPLRIPPGIILKTPRGRDAQGRKTPPRFITITNEKLQEMRSRAKQDQPVKGETRASPEKAPQKSLNSAIGSVTNERSLVGTRGEEAAAGESIPIIQGHVTLKSLLEAEIRRSIKTSGEDKQLSSDSNQQQSSKANKDCESTSSVSSPRADEESSKQPVGTNVVPRDADSPTKKHDDRNVFQGFGAVSPIFTKTPDKRTSNTGPFEKEFDYPKCTTSQPGGLLGLLLSDTNTLRRNVNDRKKNIGYKENPLTIRSSSGKTCIDSTSSDASTAKAKKADDKGEMGRQFNPSISPLKPNLAAPRSNKDARQTPSSGRTALDAPSPDSGCPNKIEIPSFPSPSEARTAAGALQGDNRDIDAKVSAVNKMRPIKISAAKTEGKIVSHDGRNKPDPENQKMDPAIEDRKIPETNGTNSNTDSSGVEYQQTSAAPTTKDDCVTDKAAVSQTNESDPSQEQGLKPKTTEGVKNLSQFSSLQTSPNTHVSNRNVGKPQGVVHPAGNAARPTVLVAIVPSRLKSSEGVVGRGTVLVNALQPQVVTATTTPVNNMVLTADVNIDAFTVWKSIFQNEFREKHGSNCEFQMLNQWMNMSAAQKRPHVHEARSRLGSQVTIKTQAPRLTKNTPGGIIIITAPRKPQMPHEMPRQNVSTTTEAPTGDIRPRAEVSENDHDVMLELYRYSGMDKFSSDFPAMTNGNRTFRMMIRKQKDVFRDPAEHFDIQFAQCVLSERKYAMDNWIAMKTKWRESPAWLVDFLVEYDIRKRKIRIARDAEVMRRVAQMMAGEQRDSSDEHNGDKDVSSAHPKLSNSHTGNKYLPYQRSDERSKGCTPGKTFEAALTDVDTQYPSSSGHGDKFKSCEIGSSKTDCSSPRATVPDQVCPSINMKENNMPTQHEKQRAVKAPGHGPTIASVQKTSGLSPQISNNVNIHTNLKSPLRSTTKRLQSVPLQVRTEGRIGKPVLTDAVDTLCDNNAGTTHKDNLNISPELWGNVYPDNFLGDLDLINDADLWNLQCSLLPPWQRHLPLMDSDSAQMFFSELDRNVARPSEPLSSDRTQHEESVEMKPFVKPKDSENEHDEMLQDQLDMPTQDLRRADDPLTMTQVDNKKDGQLPGNQNELSSDIEITDPVLDREAEDEAAVSTLLEILGEGSGSKSKPSTVEMEACSREDDRSTSMSTSEQSEESCGSRMKCSLNTAYEENQRSLHNKEDSKEDLGHRTANGMGPELQEKNRAAEKLEDKIEKWHEEIRPIIALVANSSSSSSSIEAETRSDNERRSPVTKLEDKARDLVPIKDDVCHREESDDTKQNNTLSQPSSSGEYVTADENEQPSSITGRKTPPFSSTAKSNENDAVSNVMEKTDVMSACCSTSISHNETPNSGPTSSSTSESQSAEQHMGAEELHLTDGDHADVTTEDSLERSTKIRSRRGKKKEAHVYFSLRTRRTPKSPEGVQLTSSESSVSSNSSSSSSNSTKKTGGTWRRGRKRKRNDSNKQTTAQEEKQNPQSKKSSEQNIAVSRRFGESSDAQRSVENLKGTDDTCSRGELNKSADVAGNVVRRSRRISKSGRSNQEARLKSKPKHSDIKDSIEERNDAVEEYEISSKEPVGSLKLVMKRSRSHDEPKAKRGSKRRVECSHQHKDKRCKRDHDGSAELATRKRGKAGTNKGHEGKGKSRRSPRRQANSRRGRKRGETIKSRGQARKRSKK